MALLFQYEQPTLDPLSIPDVIAAAVHGEAGSCIMGNQSDDPDTCIFDENDSGDDPL